MDNSKTFLMLFLAAVIAPSSIVTVSRDSFSIVPCKDNEDCDHLVNATCKNHVCQCGKSRLCSEKPEAVVTKIGETCRKDSECNVDFSVCQQDDKTCGCIDGYVKSTDGKRCLLVSDGIGGSCEDGVQCYARIPHSGCQNNKCICQQQMHEFNRSCFRNVELGQNCQNDAECSVNEFSKCIDSRCTCIDGFTASTNGFRCLSVADGENSPCVDDVQCTATLGGSSECADAFCKCKELYQVKNTTNKCVRDMLLGDTCVIHSDCHGPQPGLSRLECILGVCKCKSFFTEYHGYCISASTRLEPTIFSLIGSCIIVVTLLWIIEF